MTEVLRLARRFWPQLLLLLLLELLGAGLAVLAPIPLQTALDVLLQKRAMPSWLEPFSGSALPALCAASLLVTLLAQGQGLASALLSTGLGQRLIRDLRARLFAAAQRLSLARHIERGTTDTLYRIQSDAQSIEWFLLDGALPVLTAITTLALMLTTLFRLDTSLGWVGAALAPPLLLAARATRPGLKAASRDAKQKESEALGIVQATLGALTSVKAFGIEDAQTQRFAEASEKAVKVRLRIALLDGLFGMGIQTLTALGTAAALYIGVAAAQRGTLTVGQVLLGLHYLNQVYNPLKTLGKKWASLQNQMAGLERATTLLTEPSEVPEHANPTPLPQPLRGELRFENIAFGYDPRRPVLENVSFNVAPGERIGIVGETGSGKSTLLSLLMRLYSPTAGEIFLDGITLTDVKLSELRTQLAVVFQETVLLPGTLAENIAVGKPSATLTEIEAAAKAAQLHEAVGRFPDGYQTKVGERGAALSGGERQRVGLARAFLRDAPILLLDEPTSALDATTELEVLSAMERLMEGRTVLLVTHRESALRGMNRVLRVENRTLAPSPPP
ncbi:ABC transporter ATP-binding protein [Armatimonas sp.]|uniref:ABC transporter ATP-binding protein n=1 Tax=Armatimonas sp. TaxID=1872638 RepID=UPI00374D0608